MTSSVDTLPRPPAWDVLARALKELRPVRARYHGQERILCPHALGWKNGHAKVLCFQSGGTTSHGTLPQDPTQRWRSMFIDQIEEATLTDGPWETAMNHSTNSNCIDQLAMTT
jgi:hypothetical protein